jgi:hypothetical protein
MEEVKNINISVLMNEENIDRMNDIDCNQSKFVRDAVTEKFKNLEWLNSELSICKVKMKFLRGEIKKAEEFKIITTDLMKAHLIITAKGYIRVKLTNDFVRNRYKDFANKFSGRVDSFDEYIDLVGEFVMEALEEMKTEQNSETQNPDRV